MSSLQPVSLPSFAISFMALSLGLAVLVLAIWRADSCLARAVWRRAAWRAIAVAGGAWIILEAGGGTIVLARWIDRGSTAAHPAPYLPEAERRSRAHDRPHVGPAPSTDASITRSTRDTAASAAAFSPNAFAGSPQPFGLPVSSGIEPRLNRNEDGRAGAHADRAADARNTRSVTAIRPHQDGRPTPTLLVRWFLFTWIGGSIGFAAWFVGGRLLVCWFSRRHTYPAGEEFVQRVNELARSFRCGRVRVVSSRRVTAPLVFGVLRPTLVIPARLTEFLPPVQRQAVLAHELVHLAGRDPLWQVVFDALATLAWWHPCVWIARARHRAACEAAADGGAAAIPGGSQALAAALIRLGRELSSRRRLGWAAIDASGRRRARLGKRVLRLLNQRDAANDRGDRRSRVLGVATVAFSIPLLLFGTALARSGVSRSAIHEGGNPMAMWQTTWRNSLAAAALVAVLGTSVEADHDDLADPGEHKSSSKTERIESALAAQRERIAGLQSAEQEARREAILAEARENLRHAEDDLAYSERLAEKGQISDRELQSVRRAVAKAARELELKQLAAERMAAEHAARELELRIINEESRMTDAEGRARARIRHLREAAEKLKAIGENDLADKLMEEANRLAPADSSGRPDWPARPPVPPRPNTVPRQPEVPHEGALRLDVRSPEVHRLEIHTPQNIQDPRHSDLELHREKAVDLRVPEVERLREEVNELRRQVNDMREMLERVAGQLERGRNSERSVGPEDAAAIESDQPDATAPESDDPFPTPDNDPFRID